ncbi:uncharacterized protein LOC107368658 [Tetranychus urticae]|uniref:Uncharacterized protein n=1 Tax=Tetranychus urticae TaxID=32264 RepID=T1KZC6_TETUR|nr:uncharacterized protein LOC107368658 [Tetranychus urticae]
MINLDNKVALITGSSDGIGAATALLFSSLGAKVAIVGRDQSKLDKVAAECEAKSPHNYKPVVIKADFMKDDDIRRTFEETNSVYKKLDILVNNAGVICQKAFGEPQALADFDRVMQVNVRAVILLTDLAKSQLIKAKGAIVNVSSVAGLKSNSSTWSYCMSKASLDMFTKSMASLLAPHVRVNSVNPGPVRTDIIKSMGDSNAIWDSVNQIMPLKKVADPIDIAQTIAFIASDASRNMTGSIVVSDGGFLIANPDTSNTKFE